MPTTPTKKPKHTGHTSVWIPVPLRDRIDRVLQARVVPGLRPNRQAFISEVISRYLDAMERGATQS